MKILAIDQATKLSGYAILDHTKTLCDYGIFDKTKVGDTSALGHTKKRISLQEDIKNILNSYPDIIQVVCEGTYKNNTKVYKILSKIEGTIEDLCFGLNISCFTFENAGEWRKWLPVKITGKRDVVKQQTKTYILSQYPELPDNLEQDVYDAIAIALAYLHIFE